MHREHIVGTYDAAGVVTKNEEGKVKIVDKIESQPSTVVGLAWRWAQPWA